MRYMLRAILVLGLAVPLYAATHFVDVGPGLAFSPAFLLVAPGGYGHVGGAMRRWLLFLLLALSCAKQDPVHQTIEDLADAAEERDSGAVLEHLAAEFPDRAEVENQLRRYFFAYKTIDVTVRDMQVERSGSTAWATFRVDFIGLPKSVGGFDQYLPRSAKYRFELNLADKGGEWQVTGGRWEEVR